MSLSGWSTSNYISAGLNLPTSVPFTWHARVKGIADGTTVMAVGKGDNTNYWRLTGLAPSKWGFSAKDGAAATLITGGTTRGSDFDDVVVVARSSSDRELYVNGVSDGTSTVSRVVAGATVGVIGVNAEIGSAATSAKIAEVAGWNVALSVEDIAALAAGADPLSIRPDALVCLIRGDNGGTVNLVSTVATVTGTLTQDADHPAVFRSRRRQRTVPFAVTAVATSVTLSAASYAFTGSSLTSATGRKATLSASSYAFTGQALSAKTGRKQTLSPASLAYTGQSLTAQYGRKAVLSAASYSFTGSSLTAKTGRVATLTKAAYAFSGNGLTTNYGRSVTLTGATYAYTGASLTNLLSRKATLSPASLTFTGQPLVANYGRKVVLTGASFAFNGQVLGVVTGRKAVVSAAAFAYTGQSFLAKTGRKVTLNAASLAFTGQSLTVVYTPASGAYAVTLSPAAFAYAGQGLSAKTARKSALTPSSIAFTGKDLTATYAPGVAQVAYAVTLTRAAFSFTGKPLTVATSAQAEESGGKGGWDAYYYKRRNKRRTKTEDVREFLAEIETQPLELAPEQVAEQAREAEQAARAFLEEQTAALRADALKQINHFYAALRAEIARDADEEEDDDFLLLMN